MNPWPITPLTPADLSFVPVNYDFTGFTAAELGETQGILDAIDALIAEALVSIADQQTLGALMDADLNDLILSIDELDSTDYWNLLGEIWTYAPAVDAGFDTLATLVG
jgi:hypothetical protein